MGKIKFAFGIHNHQPIGNFDFVFEYAYRKSYRPFLEVLKRHPKVRISIHFTGILLDWLEEHHPDLLELVAEMVRSGQLEVMSGAYYEPILSVIPERDQIGQIKKLSARVKDLFGYEPQGMWLAERVWEPTLPSTLHKAGMHYTILDDTHFKYAGLQEEDLQGYYITEDLGQTVALFPISKTLRYTIPFQDVQNTIDELGRVANEAGDRLIVFADDGEKFGVWPGTYKHVYDEGWLEQFFSALEANSEWVEMVHFSEALQQLKPAGKIYLPTASYAEMMEWALFPRAIKQFEEFQHILQEKGLWDRYSIFVRGGFWRNFMSKYPEINVMHKKMLRISQQLTPENIPDKEKLEKALDHLWAAQCNCPYWHGVFGGLYLSHLRFAIFNNLLDAEKILDHYRALPLLEFTDFDADGQDEILIETPIHDAYFKPDQGAMMFEYDFKPVGKNILDTMTRREEAYHHKLKDAVYIEDFEKGQHDQTASIHDLVLTKERDLIRYLHYDRYERRSMVDHLLPVDSDIQAFADGQVGEIGDFLSQPYELLAKEQGSEFSTLMFRRIGTVWQNDRAYEITLNKMITVWHKKALVDVTYELRNSGDDELQFLFGAEFNFGLQAGQADNRYYYDENGRLEHYYLNSQGILPGAKMIGLRDNYLKLDIQLSSEEADEIWRLPVETISLSESGFERVYQSSSVLMVFRVTLQKAYRFTIEQKVEKVEK